MTANTADPNTGLVSDLLSVAQAEHEIISAAIWRPDQWLLLSHVRAAWFSNWADRKLWGCLQCVYRLNGIPEPDVIARLLEKHYPDEADGLLERLVSIVENFVHVEHLIYYVSILQRAGLKREQDAWLYRMGQLFEFGATRTEILEHYESFPKPDDTDDRMEVAS